MPKPKPKRSRSPIGGDRRSRVDAVLESEHLFSPIQRQDTSRDSYHIKIRPQNPIVSGDPITFVAQGDALHGIDLSDTKLYIRVKLTKNDGTDFDADTRAAFVNYPIVNLFERVECFLNDTRVTDDPNYSFKGYIEALLESNSHAQKHQLALAGFYLDDANEFDSTTIAGNTNSGFVSRQDLTDESASLDLIGCIHSDIFKTRRILPPGVSVRLVFYPHSEKFSVLANAGVEAKVKMGEIVVFLKKVLLTDTSKSRILRELDHRNAVYPIPRTQVRLRPIAAGVTSVIIDNFVTSAKLPNTIIIGFVPTKAVQGDLTLNPYNFVSNKLRKLVLMVNEKRYPRESSLDTVDAWRYLSLFDQQNFLSGIGPSIRPKAHLDGYFLTKFQLTDIGANYVSSPQSGFVNIEIDFGQVVPADGLTMVAYLKFSCQVEINKEREVSVHS